jgi:hypothetical protein
MTWSLGFELPPPLSLVPLVAGRSTADIRPSRPTPMRIPRSKALPVHVSAASYTTADALLAAAGEAMMMFCKREVMIKATSQIRFTFPEKCHFAPHSPEPRGSPILSSRAGCTTLGLRHLQVCHLLLLQSCSATVENYQFWKVQDELRIETESTRARILF